jgi:hypothetical protein
MTETSLTQLNEAELDAVSAGFNLVLFFAPKQTNYAKQTSFNGLAVLSGNQSVQQLNNASVGSPAVV